jgi:hypothetical protein
MSIDNAMRAYPNLIVDVDELATRNKRNNMFLGALFNLDKNDVLHIKDLSNNILQFNSDMCADFLKITDPAKKYHNSDTEYEMWRTIKNLRDKLKANSNDLKKNMIEFPADYYTLYQAIITDLTRVRADLPDWTGQLSNETIRLDAPNPMPIREMLEFAGKMEKYVVGQPAPLVQEKTGQKESIAIDLYDIGYTRSLYSVLFDLEIFQMQKVIRAVARAYTGLRNSLVWNPILNATWDASQIVTADTTGTTYDEILYNTLLKAYMQISLLLDCQTRQDIAVPRLALGVRNRPIAWYINRIMNGGLVPSQAAAVRVFAPLDIAEIWPYPGDAWTWGKDPVSYPGIDADTAYLFVPGSAGSPYYTIVKAPLTMEVGRGGVLTHDQEQRAWYSGQGNYVGEFLGSSGEFTAQFPHGYGHIVKIELPTPPST